MPGRVCILGEHSDWAGGFRRFNPELSSGRTIVCGTNDGLHARVRRHPSALVITTTTEKVSAPMQAMRLVRVYQNLHMYTV